MNPKGLRLIAFMMSRGNSLSEDEANASLIAAAPDLLATVQAFTDYYPPGINPYLDEAATAGRAALVKAVGKVAEGSAAGASLQSLQSQISQLTRSNAELVKALDSINRQIGAVRLVCELSDRVDDELAALQKFVVAALKSAAQKE